MGSLEAMENGSKDRYFQSGTSDVKKLVPDAQYFLRRQKVQQLRLECY